MSYNDTRTVVPRAAPLRVEEITKVNFSLSGLRAEGKGALHSLQGTMTTVRAGHQIVRAILTKERMFGIPCYKQGN